MAEKKAKKLGAKKLYTVTVECAGESLVSETNDILEALQQFAPPIIKGEIVVRVVAGEKTRERLFPAMRARQVFQNKDSVFLLARDIIRSLEDDRDNLTK